MAILKKGELTGQIYNNSDIKDNKLETSQNMGRYEHNRVAMVNVSPTRDSNGISMRRCLKGIATLPAVA